MHPKLCKVRGWQSRGRVPQAIETTATLIEIGLSDSGWACSRSDHELRLLYSLCFIRCVSFVALYYDLMQ